MTCVGETVVPCSIVMASVMCLTCLVAYLPTHVREHLPANSMSCCFVGNRSNIPINRGRTQNCPHVHMVQPQILSDLPSTGGRTPAKETQPKITALGADDTGMHSVFIFLECFSTFCNIGDTVEAKIITAGGTVRLPRLILYGRLKPLLSGGGSGGPKGC